MTETKYTIFARWAEGTTHAGHECWFPPYADDGRLQQRIDYVRDFNGPGTFIPIAWAINEADDGALLRPLLAESKAAGRVIEFRDGKYIPLGVAEEAPKPVPSLGALLRQALERGNVKPADGRKEPSDPSALRDRDHIAPKQKRADFDPWKGFFAEPADIADWQDTYFPR